MTHGAVTTGSPRPARLRGGRWLALAACIVAAGAAAVPADAGQRRHDPTQPTPYYDPPDDLAGSICDPNTNPQVPRSCETWVSPLIESQERLEAITPQLKNLWGERWAGSWQYHEKGDMEPIQTNVVGLTPEDEAVFHRLTGGDPHLVLTNVRHPLRVLDELVPRVRAFLLERAPRPNAHWAYVDHRANLVAVDIRFLDPATVEELQGIGPPGAINVAVHEGFGLRLAHGTRSEYPPYEGGLGITVGE